MIESQIKYIAEALLYCKRYNIDEIEVVKQAEDEWNQHVQRKLIGTVWQNGGCSSWYKNKAGINTTLWHVIHHNDIVS